MLKDIRPVRKSVISSQVSQFSQAKALRKLVNSKLMIRKLKFPNISIFRSLSAVEMREKFVNMFVSTSLNERFLTYFSQQRSKSN